MNNRLKRTRLYLYVTALLFVLFLSVGFGALTTNLNISGSTKYNIKKPIRITDVILQSATGGGVEQFNPSYTWNTVTIGTNYTSSGTVTYQVTITNYSNNIYNLSYIVNSNKTYNIVENYTNPVGEGTYTFNITISASSGLGTTTVTMNYAIASYPTLYSLIGAQAVPDNTSSTYVSSSSGINFGQTSSNTNGKGVYTFASTINNEYPVYYYRGNVSNNNVLFGGFCWKAVITTSTGGTKLIYNGVPSNGKCTNTTGTSTQVGTSAFNTNKTDPGKNGYMYGPASSINALGAASINYTVGYETDISSYYFGTGFQKNGLKYNLLNSTTYENTSFSTHHYYSESTTFAQIDFTAGKIKYLFAIIEEENETRYYYVTVSKYSYTSIDSILDLMYTNTNDSTIKEYLDNWFSNNLMDYSHYLEDESWCSNLTMNTNSSSSSQYTNNGWIQNGGSPYNYLWYGNYGRIYDAKSPSISCDYSNGKFSVSSSNGNGKLTYPVGLLTVDEHVLAGEAPNKKNESMYLYNGEYYWAMSPLLFTSRATNFGFLIPVSDSTATLSGYMRDRYSVEQENGVRPSVSLKNDVKVSSGNGTSNTPYVIDNSEGYFTLQLSDSFQLNSNYTYVFTDTTTGNTINVSTNPIQIPRGHVIHLTSYDGSNDEVPVLKTSLFQTGGYLSITEDDDITMNNNWTITDIVLDNFSVLLIKTMTNLSISHKLIVDGYTSRTCTRDELLMFGDSLILASCYDVPKKSTVNLVDSGGYCILQYQVDYANTNPHSFTLFNNASFTQVYSTGSRDYAYINNIVLGETCDASILNSS